MTDLSEAQIEKAAEAARKLWAVGEREWNNIVRAGAPYLQSQPESKPAVVDRDWLVATVMLQSPETLQRIHDAIAHRVQSQPDARLLASHEKLVEALKKMRSDVNRSDYHTRRTAFEKADAALREAEAITKE